MEKFSRRSSLPGSRGAAADWWSCRPSPSSGPNSTACRVRGKAGPTGHSMMQGKLARPMCPSRRALAGMPRVLVQRLEIDFEMAFDLDEAAWPQRRVLDFQVLLDKI